VRACTPSLTSLGWFSPHDGMYKVAIAALCILWLEQFQGQKKIDLFTCTIIVHRFLSMDQKEIPLSLDELLIV
jgi:hypothetical protein